MRPNVTNWIVGSSAVASTGVLTGNNFTTGPGTWSIGGTAVTLASGVPFTVQAAVIAQAPMAGNPTLGRMRVDEIKGTVTVYGSATATAMAVAVGIYVAESTSAVAFSWDVRDPLSVAGASMDDYFFLEAQVLDMPEVAEQLAPSSMVFHLKLANPLIIGGGQAVHVTTSMIGPATALMKTAFRTRIGPVA